MKHITNHFLLVLTLILSACGGGSGGTTDGTATAPANAQIAATGTTLEKNPLSAAAAPASTTDAATSAAQAPADAPQANATPDTAQATTPPAETPAAPAPAPIPAPAPAPTETPAAPPALEPAPAPAPAPVVTAPASSWTRCATEYGACSFSGTRTVRYGFGDQWATRVATGTLDCSNATFGDPAPGASKVCDYSASTTTVPVTTTQIIEYYGDSTIYGYVSGSGGQVAKPAPTVFAESLPNPSAYIVRNEGVNSSTACDLLNGTDGRHKPWATQMAESKARYVIANHAINDEWKYDVATYQSCLRSLARTAKQYGKQMIFETPNPTRDSGSWGLDVYVNAMKQVATQEGVPVIDQYKYLTDYLNGQSAYTICPDGLHPTDAVYGMKGRYAASVFPTLIK